MIKKMNRKGFTLVELLTVMAVIAILAGLVLSTAGYVQKKAASSRAESEIQALSAACEGYKTDNGIYPRGPSAGMTIGGIPIPKNATDSLDPRTSGTPSGYVAAGLYLYTQLSGDTTGAGQVASGVKSYMEFKPNMLGFQIPGSPPSASNKITALQDPFGYSYGYSTAYQADIENNVNPPKRGYNPTFDLWSTAGNTATTGTNQWIKNW